MKILILGNSSEGMFRFRKELILRLLQQEHEIWVSVPADGKQEDIEALGCSYIPTELDRRGLDPRKDLRLLRFYKKTLRAIRPDFVITYTIKPNIYGGFAVRQRKIPYAVNITGLGTAFERQGMLQAMVVRMYRYALGKAKVVFFENSQDRETMLTCKTVDASRTCVLPGAGVNLTDYPYQEYPNNKIPRFLFIGRVMKEKGIDELLSAVRKLNQENCPCMVDVVGPFEEAYDEKLKLAEREGWLSYHGYQNDVRPFIRNADCFVLPSYHEGMANVNLESASCGRPVITSNISGCKEAVQDGISGYLCEVKSSESLFDAMRKMWRLTAEERKNMGIAGRTHMEKMFDKRKVVDQTIHMIGLNSESSGNENR